MRAYPLRDSSHYSQRTETVLFTVDFPLRKMRSFRSASIILCLLLSLFTGEDSL